MCPLFREQYPHKGKHNLFKFAKKTRYEFMNEIRFIHLIKI